MNSLLSVQMRRTFLNSSACRGMYQFNYPHSFRGVNNAYNQTPHNDQYPQ